MENHLKKVRTIRPMSFSHGERIVRIPNSRQTLVNVNLQDSNAALDFQQGMSEQQYVLTE